MKNTRDALLALAVVDLLEEALSHLRPAGCRWGANSGSASYDGVGDSFDKNVATSRVQRDQKWQTPGVKCDEIHTKGAGQGWHGFCELHQR